MNIKELIAILKEIESKEGNIPVYGTNVHGENMELGSLDVEARAAAHILDPEFVRNNRVPEFEVVLLIGE